MVGNGNDLRRFPRFRQSMMIKIINGSNYTGRTIDVSENGAKITVGRPLKVGERLCFELFLRDSDPFPLRFVGECRWCEPSEIEESVAGIDLTPSHARSLAVLRDYLSLREA